MAVRVAITPTRSARDYERSVLEAGGDPRVLDLSSATPARLLDEADALLLTGGADIDPALYGEARHATFQEAEPGRDAAEIGLVLQAMATGLPVLAICRGAQVVNVALGGSLIQDIPSQVPMAVNHRVPDPKTAVAHDIHVPAGTRLGALLGLAREGGSLTVNSRHHQSPNRIGEGLIVSAVAIDGVVEALELPDHPFCVAVQWHPENFVETGEFQALFNGLLEAARAQARL
jgi:putative glutamine amidotransferase